MLSRRPLIDLLAISLFAVHAAHAEETPAEAPSKKPAPKAPMMKSVTKSAPKSPAEETPEKSPGENTDKTTPEKVVPGSRKNEPVYDLARLAPRIVVEMRYATARNLARRPIYPPGARCLVRESVAQRLSVAQAYLRDHADPGTTLKIWDGYRPASAQRLLWQLFPNKEYLGDPRRQGSLHTWGVCVDATLCDSKGRDFKMPTDFDVLTPEASTYYLGKNQEVRRNLHQLQAAMTHAGFLVVRDEWWHFVARDHEAFGPLNVPLALPQKNR